MAKTKNSSSGTASDRRPGTVDKAIDDLGHQPGKSQIRKALGKEPSTPNAGRHPKSAKGATIIDVARGHYEAFDVPVVGMLDTSLIVHNWSAKAVRMLLGQHMGIDEGRLREPKVPFDDFLGTLYVDRLTGEMQIRTIMFKNAMLEAVRMVDGVKPMDARYAIQVVGEFAPLYGQPTCRMDAVKVGMFPNVTTDLRFRAEFREWIAVLRFKFDPKRISRETILNLLEMAGTNVGIGDWRPMRNGVSGTFELLRGDVATELNRLRRWRLSELTPENTGTEELLRTFGLDRESTAALLAPPKPSTTNGSTALVDRQ